MHSHCLEAYVTGEINCAHTKCMRVCECVYAQLHAYQQCTLQTVKVVHMHVSSNLVFAENEFVYVG